MSPKFVKTKAYISKHNRVRYVKGSASTRKCVGCGKKAMDWSQKHGTSGSEPSHYQPRCRTCHRRYDMRKRKK